MPTLDFKGKQNIHARHLAVPYRTIVPNAAYSLNPAAYYMIRNNCLKSGRRWIYRKGPIA